MAVGGGANNSNVSFRRYTREPMPLAIAQMAWEDPVVDVVQHLGISLSATGINGVRSGPPSCWKSHRNALESWESHINQDRVNDVSSAVSEFNVKSLMLPIT